MRRDTTKKYYIVHSWMGVVTAILLFIVCYTGAFSVFGRPELKVWANPEVRGQISTDFPAVENLIRRHAKNVDAEYLHHVRVTFAGTRSPTLQIGFEKEVETPSGEHQHHVVVFKHHPKTLVLLDRFEGSLSEWFQQWPTDMADYMVTFHADLHLGSPWGLVLTGVLGLTLFASAATGVIIHRKFFKELFSFRPMRSLRLLFTDAHKVLGVWGLLFHTVIGFTGAFLGLALVLLVPAAAFVSFSGDQEKLVETFIPEVEPALTGTPATSQPARILRAFSEANPQLVAIEANFHGWGDEGAVMEVVAMGGEQLSASRTLEFNAVTGELLSDYTAFGRQESATGVVLDAMYPLHFGNFGGLFVKIVWSVLGVGTAMLAVTGMMIWVERRAYGPEGRLSVKAYHRISRFTVGSCMGVVVASLLLFHGQLLLNILNLTPQKQPNWFNALFFGGWLLSIAWALVRTNSYRTIKELFAVCAVAAVGVPFLNALVTGDALPLAMTQGKWITAGVDVTLLLFGGLCIWLARRLPSVRPQPRSKAKAGPTPYRAVEETL